MTHSSANISRRHSIPLSLAHIRISSQQSTPFSYTLRKQLGFYSPRKSHSTPKPLLREQPPIRTHLQRCQRAGAHDDREDRVELHTEERDVRQQRVQSGRRPRHHGHLSDLHEAAAGHEATQGEYADEGAAGEPGQGRRREVLVLADDQEDEDDDDAGDHAEDAEEEALARAVAADPAAGRRGAQLLQRVELLVEAAVRAPDVLAHHEGHRCGYQAVGHRVWSLVGLLVGS